MTDSEDFIKPDLRNSRGGVCLWFPHLPACLLAPFRKINFCCISIRMTDWKMAASSGIIHSGSGGWGWWTVRLPWTDMAARILLLKPHVFERQSSVFPSYHFFTKYVKISIVPCIPQNRVTLRHEHKILEQERIFKVHPTPPSVSHWGIKKWRQRESD